MAVRKSKRGSGAMDGAVIPGNNRSLEVKTATLAEAIEVMSNGNHCLWVGAGATMQIVGRDAAMSWVELVEKMEKLAPTLPPPRRRLRWSCPIDLLKKTAGLAVPSDPQLPRRLELCCAAMGVQKFRQIVRAELHDRMYQKIVQMARDEHRAGRVEVPLPVRALAHLGAIGNPIVSFNIEMATAIALSMPNGSPLIKTYSKSANHHLPYVIGERPHGLARKVFLPHGCLELADCVLTEDEYISHQASMSFQLATHQAYSSGLFIVGFSLSDAYLLEQIKRFRRWIETIYWIQPESDAKQRELAERYDLTLVSDGTWPDFWQKFENPLHEDLKPGEAALYATWIKLIDDALLYLDTPFLLKAEGALDPIERTRHLAEADSAGDGRPVRSLSSSERTDVHAYRSKLREREASLLR